MLDPKVKEKKLIDQWDIFNLVKNSDLNTKLSTLAIKAGLKAEQYKIVKFQAFDSNYFCGKNHFEDDVTHNYLVFQPIYKCFETIGNSWSDSAWKSKRQEINQWQY